MKEKKHLAGALISLTIIVLSYMFWNPETIGGGMGLRETLTFFCITYFATFTGLFFVKSDHKDRENILWSTFLVPLVCGVIAFILSGILIVFFKVEAETNRLVYLIIYGIGLVFFFLISYSEFSSFSSIKESREDGTLFKVSEYKDGTFCE